MFLSLPNLIQHRWTGLHVLKCAIYSESLSTTKMWILNSLFKVLSNCKNAMGLTISSSIWQLYINARLECLQSRKYCEAIMNNVLLFTPTKKAHMVKLEDLLKALLKDGLKLSPKKCQLFQKELQYMGNAIFLGCH